MKKVWKIIIVLTISGVIAALITTNGCEGLQDELRKLWDEQQFSDNTIDTEEK